MQVLLVQVGQLKIVNSVLKWVKRPQRAVCTKVSGMLIGPNHQTFVYIHVCNLYIIHTNLHTKKKRKEKRKKKQQQLSKKDKKKVYELYVFVCISISPWCRVNSSQTIFIDLATLTTYLYTLYTT